MGKTNSQRMRSRLQTRLLVYFCAIILTLSSIIFGVMYAVFRKTVITEVLKTRQDVLHQIGNNCKLILNEVESVSNIYYFNSQINEMIADTAEKSGYERVQENNMFNALLTQYRYAYELQGIAFYLQLYAMDGRAFTYFPDSTYLHINQIKNSSWYSGLLEKNGDILWLPSYHEPERSEKYMFSAARLMKHPYSQRTTGVLMLNVQEDVLAKTYQEQDETLHSIVIVDENGTIISSREKEEIGKTYSVSMEEVKKSGIKSDIPVFVDDGSRMLLVSRKISPMGWYIVETTPEAAVLSSAKAIRFIFISITIAGMAFAFLITAFVTSWLLNPINHIVNAMKKAQKGDFRPIVVQNSSFETAYLVSVYNQLVLKINDLMEERLTNEKKRRQIEIDFLQAQINPHFLHNTLFSIKCMMSMNQSRAAENMLMSFMRLLRRTFENTAFCLTVSDEISMLKDYATVQSYKYEGKFSVVYEIAQDVMNLYIPKMLLQPILENAIFYGIEHDNDDSQIIVKGLADGGKLVLSVSDSGCGMTSEQVQSLLAGDASRRKNFTSVGIPNINSRIKLCFGDEYGVQITTDKGKGTTVTIFLPFMEEPFGDIKETSYENIDCR